MKIFAALFVVLHAAAAAQLSYQPAELVSENGVLDVTLEISMLESLNGTRIGPAYNGAPIGPTLRVKPGDKVTVTLVNNLDPPSSLDRELYSYVMDPDNAETADANVTVIYNRLSAIGNVYSPEFGYWGRSYNNLHFHGAQVSPSIENISSAIGGGESKTYEFQIPEDRDPGLHWYHNHAHGLATYSYLASLFGFFVIEGTDLDLTKAKGVEGATEVFMLMSEGLVNPDKTVPDFFPIVGAFNWSSVANGVLGAATNYEFTQGETALFRMASATIEAPVRLTVPGMTFVVLAYDGIPMPSPQEVEVVELAGGGRVEFLARFDEPGTYEMTRLGWGSHLVPNAEACLAAFGVEMYPCISYDVDTLAATITVMPAEDGADLPTVPLIDTVELPAASETLVALEAIEPSDAKQVVLQQAASFPIFQIPYDGPFVPPGVGFGINERLATPYYVAGTVVADTCETWEVISTPPGLGHSFHGHTSRFMVTHIDGIEVEAPFWRDTMPINGANITAHICFNTVEPGDMAMVHCHAPAHLDIGMAAFYEVVAPEETGESTSAGSGLSFIATYCAAFLGMLF